MSNPSAHISSSMPPPIHVDLRGVLHVQPEPGADRPAPVVRLAGVAAPGVAAHRAQPQGGHLLTRSYGSHSLNLVLGFSCFKNYNTLFVIISV